MPSYLRFSRLFQLLEPRPVPVPPGVEFALIGVNGGLFLMRMAMNGQAFGFPAADSTFAITKIGGDLLPGIQAVARRTFRSGLPEGGDFMSHEWSPCGGACGFYSLTGGFATMRSN